MIIKGAVINDIHFGVRDSQRIYNELEQFKKFVNDNDIQTVIIAGDYFDRKLTVGDPATFYAISFFKELFDICKNKKIKLRMIQGTRSHELNQLSLFFPFVSDIDANFRIIETVSEEELFPEFNVLYIPEEYPENADEYYKEFKEKKYNAIFGHGTWDFVAFDNQIEHGKRTDILSAPVFLFEEWKNSIEHGFISFGHIHSRHTYKKKVFYSGSFSRWDFSDISERGFSYFEYDLDKQDFKLNFIDNVEAPIFSVFSLKDMLTDLENAKAEDIQIILNEQLNHADNIVFDLSGLNPEMIAIFKEQYKNNPNVKIKASDKKAMLKESEELETRFEKYNYIIKRELPLNETIKRYCQEEYGKDISLEKITEVLK